MVRDCVSKRLYYPFYRNKFKKSNVDILKISQQKEKYLYGIDKCSLLELQKVNLLKLLEVHLKNDVYGDIIKRVGIPKNTNFDIEKYISNFPILQKSEIQEKFDSLLNTKAKRVYMNSSGGSTGIPVNIWQDENYYMQSRATKFVSDRMQGWYQGCREVRLWGAPKDFSLIKGPRAQFRMWLKNLTWLDSFDMGENEMTEMVETINKIKPEVIIAYASSIYILAKFIKENNLNIKTRLRGIISSAEILFPHMRDEIESVFNANVLNRYGSREVGCIATECQKKNGLHLHMYDHIVEVVDDQNRQVFDEEGRILVTSLNNYAMPIIRYEIGDLGVFSEGHCECGIQGYLLDKIVGRSSDSIKTATGRIIHGEYFTHIFYGMKGVKSFQFVQESLEYFSVNLVCGPEFDKHNEKKIIKECLEVLDSSSSIIINYLDKIETNRVSGKYRYTISKL
ncbi:hypothetical protein P9J64_03710 [Deltaproteobacteria bacterium IMCC39524]|nr:hypothetical protein [Deltaproteobacteria bacterium IMCC39524]